MKRNTFCIYNALYICTGKYEQVEFGEKQVGKEGFEGQFFNW